MKKIILIFPWAKQLRNGKENAKNYPFWNELVVLLKNEGFHTIQVGISGEREIGADEKRLDLSLEELEKLINDTYTGIGIDSFANHFYWFVGKRGIFIFGKSDPLIFGHKENINLLKDRRNLREDSFRWWEDVVYDKNVFVSPQEVYDKIKENLPV